MATEGPRRQSTTDAAASSCPDCLMTPATRLPTRPNQPQWPPDPGFSCCCGCREADAQLLAAVVLQSLLTACWQDCSNSSWLVVQLQLQLQLPATWVGSSSSSSPLSRGKQGRDADDSLRVCSACSDIDRLMLPTPTAAAAGDCSCSISSLLPREAHLLTVTLPGLHLTQRPCEALLHLQQHQHHRLQLQLCPAAGARLQRLQLGTPAAPFRCAAPAATGPS